ncbi:MAG TPA: hypothetical protein VFE33_18595 [Thermoanaerobaculia bacterium]|nr:hypothetical protein [Thermoanaerobaculia bacterium]
MLRPETKEDLRAELEWLAKRMDHIKGVLEEDESQPLQGELPLAADPRKVALKKKSAKFVRTGLRQWIRDAVAAEPGLTAAAIAKRVEAKGFTSDAKTQLAVRVNNEARRMANADHLKKRGAKYYPADRANE